MFNPKIKLFINGRKRVFQHLENTISASDKVIWFHCASLGEFEQGRPIIEKTKSEFPNHKILLTFFSPSGYEVRKNYKGVTIISYLPLDTKLYMKKFIEIAHPELVVFVKYEFWPNVLKQLKTHNIPTILVSGIFRKEQAFFKYYGAWMRKSLKTFHHFFVQNDTSKELLNLIKIKNVTVSGDTRFDRVLQIQNQQKELDFIEAFKNNSYLLVAGSTWNEDEKLLVHYINNEAKEHEKFVIAPHNINQKDILELKASVNKKAMLFSEIANVSSNTLNNQSVLIIDTIGLLTKIYAYANVAYVGGGLASGLHNILEPATFGIPVVFGAYQYEKFQEAKDLLQLKGCIKIKNQAEFSSCLHKLKNEEILRKNMGVINSEYIHKKTGATNIILNYIYKQLKN